MPSLTLALMQQPMYTYRLRLSEATAAASAHAVSCAKDGKKLSPEPWAAPRALLSPHAPPVQQGTLAAHTGQ